jgi:hypothetical protein
MSNHRLRILIGVATGLAGLTWLDSASIENSESNLSSEVISSDRETGIVTRTISIENTMKDDVSPKRIAASNENPISYLRVENLRETVDRPLFAPSRRQPPKKRKAVVRAPAPVIAPQVQQNNYQLLGVIRSEERSIALLAERKNGLNFRVETGDLIGGWYVKHVMARQIILEQNHIQVVLSMP